jgi:hypothetical protein
MEIEIGTRLMTAIAAVLIGLLVERWWNYASRRR